MNKNIIAVSILVLCFLSLLVGIFSPCSKQPQENLKTSQLNKSSVNVLSKDRIVLIKFSGVIDSSDNSGYFPTNLMTAQGLIDALKTVKEDSTVKGVVIKLNTPGGTVGMSQNIYDAIIALRGVKPVVISMDDIAASGGYYISSAADRIFAQRGTLTGSIGVIFSTMDIHELLSQKLLIKSNIIKSGKFKDIGSQYKEMTTEERTLLKNIIDDSYNQFLSDIKKGRIQRNDKYSVPKRNLDDNTLKQYADGRIFTGTQALNYGFVDGLGDINVAYEAANKMACEKFNLSQTKLPFDKYSKHQNFSDYILESLGSIFENKTKSAFDDYIPASIKYSKQPLYLWE